MEEERIGGWGSVGRLGECKESVIGWLVHCIHCWYSPLLQYTGGAGTPSVHDQGCGPGEP